MARLNRIRWIEEGLLALQAEGAGALAADRMAKRLGVTRGSFYWHFANAMEFEAAVLAEWEERWTSRIIAAVATAEGTPRDQLLGLIERTGGQDASIYASARRMARLSPPVAELMARVDERRVAFVTDILLAGSVGRDDAAARAAIIYSWAMGQMLVSGDRPVATEMAELLADFAFA